MPVLIKVSKVTSPKSLGYGKHYGHVVTTKTMSYQELCKHMAEHNSVYGEDVCLGVANKLQSCMLEQLLEGKKVQFGDLGTFYLSVKTKGEEKEEDFNMGTSIQDLRLRSRVWEFRKNWNHCMVVPILNLINIIEKS